MLNIKSKIPDNINHFTLFDSGKSCYVISRYCLEVTFWSFYVPGFLLMQQSLENLIKASLKKENISWSQNNGSYGNKGHNFKRLIELGKDIEYINKFSLRTDFMDLLKELEDGYNPQRYGESGHFISDSERMIDLFDEMVYLLVYGYSASIEPNDKKRLEQQMTLPVSKDIQEIFKRKLKQPFIITETISLDFIPNTP